MTLRPRPGYVPKSLSECRLFICLPCLLSHRPHWMRTLRLRCDPSGLLGFTSTVRPAFGNLTSSSWDTVVVQKAGPFQSRGFPTGLWTLSRLLIRAEVWNALCTLEPTQQGPSPPPGHCREVCLFRIYALQLAGLLRIPLPGFTGWMFSS